MFAGINRQRRFSNGGSIVGHGLALKVLRGVLRNWVPRQGNCFEVNLFFSVELISFRVFISIVFLIWYYNINNLYF